MVSFFIQESISAIQQVTPSNPMELTYKGEIERLNLKTKAYADSIEVLLWELLNQIHDGNTNWLIL